MSKQNKDKTRSGKEVIYELLKKDHKEVKSLFKQILDKCTPSQNVYSQIENALKVHMQGEEQYFYPALRKGKEMNFMVNEAIVEHNAAKTMMEEIRSTNIKDEMWVPRLKVLSESIDHHVEEEEDELFKEAKKILDEKQEYEIAEKFNQAKSQIGTYK